ncbi:ufm1-specific protease 1-like [Ptychodera flava]|uniref:ufm1-specific protease 1-like n=1 Tax=Ptychodera flava TaxID=63121 RepID=UPI00396A6627
MDDKLRANVHQGLPPPGDARDVSLVTGDYAYYHYGCDGLDDRGWGCGYRTLQTMCSWIRQQSTNKADTRQVPSIPEIQKALVAMGDKEQRFVGSKDWIGSFEVCLCLDYFYDVPCKIIHIQSGDDINSKIPELIHHFQNIGSPVMMGGDSDNSSKGILGVAKSSSATYLLVLDPHFYGNPDMTSLQQDGWIKWRPLDSFMSQSFYNFCLPQFKTR